MRNTPQCIAATVFAIALSACVNTPVSRSSSLYERLGGKPAIKAVIDDFVANVAADARINGQFAQTDIARLKRLLVEQVCAVSGGPCQYTGRDMKSAHAHLKITAADFNALVEDLTRTLDKFKVPDQEKGELMSLLGPMQRDIVTVN